MRRAEQRVRLKSLLKPRRFVLARWIGKAFRRRRSDRRAGRRTAEPEFY